jgi:hypothetical protein
MGQPRLATRGAGERRAGGVKRKKKMTTQETSTRDAARKTSPAWRAPVAFASLTALLAAGALFTTAQAQAPAADAAVQYAANKPGSTANTPDKPPENTPVPAWAQESYKIYMQMKTAAKGGRTFTRATYDKMPNWSGAWTRREGGLKFDPLQPGQPGDGKITAELTPRYEAAYRQKLKEVAAGNEWDQLSNCLPAGFPRLLTEPFLREYVLTPQETWLINEQQSEARRIYTDDRGHIPEDAAQSYWDGDSIGFWDGDTLVIHTIRVMHGQYQRNQPDYSTHTSIIERIRMTDPNTIEQDVTVFDPRGLKKPWHVIDHYTRVTTPGSRIDMWSCNSNNNVVRTPTGGSQFVLPGETVTIQQPYKNPDTFYLTDTQKKLFDGDEDDGN